VIDHDLRFPLSNIEERLSNLANQGWFIEAMTATSVKLILVLQRQKP